MPTPPNNKKYEASILASLVLDTTAIELVVDILLPEDFYSTKHMHIYQAICELYRDRSPIDLVTVSEKLNQLGTMDKVGALALSQIVDFPVATDIEFYAKKVKEKSGLRRVIEICNAASKRAFRESETPVEIIDRFQADIHAISLSVSSDNNFGIGELINESMEQYKSLLNETNGVTGIPTGYFMWDYLSCGLQNTDLNILAGRPSMGKTALALNLTRNIASHGDPVQWFSLEMSKRQLRDRLMAAEAKVDGQKFRAGGFTNSEMDRIEKAQSVLYQYPISIDDEAGLSHMEIRRRARRYQMDKGTRLIIIDHLQLVGQESTDNRNNELGIYTRAFKAMAKELNIPVVVLSQLNRNLEHRIDKVPRLSDLRESGNIEQDADNVYFIHRTAKYTDLEENYPGESLLVAAKQRNGPTGFVELEWLERFQEFITYDKRHEKYKPRESHQVETYRRDIHD